MKAIYKYNLPVKEKCVIELPKGSQIIRVDDVDGLFYLWAIVDTDENCPLEKRALEFYKTDQPIENADNLLYIGMCKLFIMQELGLYVFENILETIHLNQEQNG